MFYRKSGGVIKKEWEMLNLTSRNKFMNDYTATCRNRNTNNYEQRIRLGINFKFIMYLSINTITCGKRKESRH